MLILNLVSQDLKKEIKLRHIYKMFKQINCILIIITIFVAVIMLVAKMILQNNFNDTVAQTTLITRDTQGRNSKIREINNRLSFVEKIQSDFVIWSLLFEDLGKYVSDDLNFYSVKIDREAKTISLRGRAKTRSSLLALKDGLEKSNIFFGVDFPVKNILEKNDIDFDIKANLNLDYLKEIL